MTEKKSVFEYKFKEQAQFQAMRDCDKTLEILTVPRKPLSDMIDEIWYRKWETLLNHQIAKFVCLFELVWELHERIKLLEEEE